MTIPTISTLPTAPARTDPPATFVTRADSFLAALVVMQGELNTSIGAMNTDIAGVNADAVSAAADAVSAAASAAAAEAASNATEWVSGTSYAEGDVVYSQIDFKSYRANTATSGTTDPSLSADWNALSYDLPSQTGNAGKFLSTDGTDESWVEVSASPTLEAVASGTLANGQTVIVNANGTVSAVSGADQDLGTPILFESAETYPSTTFDSNSNKVVICYSDYGNSGKGTAVVGTVSGTSISFGTPVVFSTGSTFWMSVTFDSNDNKIVVAYQNPSGSDYGTAVVGTVSGTSISFGSPVVFATVNTTWTAATFDSNSNKVVIAYRENLGSYLGKAIVGTVSGTSISFGSAVAFGGSSVHTSMAFDSNLNKVVISSRNDSGSLYGEAVVGTVSGTSISFGTPVVFASSNTTFTSTAFDSNSNKIIIGYQEAAVAEHGKAIIGTVSGTSISFGSAVYFEAASTSYINIVFDSNAKKAVISYKDAGNSNYGTLIVGTVSGTSISFGSPLVFETSTSESISAAFDSNLNKIVIAYQDVTDSRYGKSVVFQNESTTLTTENYIGISDGAYSDSATATVQIVGSVDDAQSGLTAGKSYYVQTDGTLNTTAADPSVFAGTAVSATKLIVKG